MAFSIFDPKSVQMELHMQKAIIESIRLRQEILADPILLGRIEEVAQVWVSAFQTGHKMLFCGNGGSAADAQHLSAELSGRYYFDREPLPAEALHVNTSYLTAVANDYSFDEVYARMVRASGQAGDVLVVLSTSGNSRNILRALEDARQKQMITVGFTGQTGGQMTEYCDYLINIPSTDTPRIQECHMLIGHILCELTESRIFSQP